MKLDIQLFGGRGANSSYGQEGYNTGGSNKGMAFYDKTNIYKGMTVQQFEERVGKFKSEYIGLYGDDNRIIIAGTSYNQGSVAIPTTHPDFNKTHSMTHTHPANGTRQLGGSLSGADVQNTALLNLRTVRARAPEKTYILRAKKGAKQNSGRLYGIATQSDKKWDRNARIRISKINNRLKKGNKQLSSKVQQRIYLGYGTRLWKRSLDNTGYEYIEIRKKNR